MQDVIDGSTQFLYGIVLDGDLGEAYENLFGQKGDNKE